MLAGLVQSPTNDDPITNPENALIRRNQVLQRMNNLGHITDQELAEISAQPVAGRRGRRTRRTAASTPPSAASSAPTSAAT